MPTAAAVRRAIADLADPTDARNLARFFQTQPGGYGEGDVFVGVRVPALRQVAKAHADLPLDEARALLDDAQHEHRFAALVIWVNSWRRAGRTRSQDAELQRRLHAAYLDAVYGGRVNNWDLVDVSAEWLVGEHVRVHGGTAVLASLVEEHDLWRRRVGILATFAWTKAGDPAPALAAATAVLDDRRDLIQKASGWMLREVGKRVDRDVLVRFLDEHASAMGGPLSRTRPST